MANRSLPPVSENMSNQQALALVLSLAEQGMNHAASSIEQYAQWAAAIDQIKACAWLLPNAG